MVTNNRPFEHHPSRSKFTLDWDGHTGWVDYDVRDGVWYLLHAEVPAVLRGQGVGQVLVVETYAYLRKHAIKSVPVCSYIQALVRRSPDLVKTFL